MALKQLLIVLKMGGIAEQFERPTAAGVYLDSEDIGHRKSVQVVERLLRNKRKTLMRA
jgi:hypothetical protein